MGFTLHPKYGRTHSIAHWWLRALEIRQSAAVSINCDSEGEHTVLANASTDSAFYVRPAMWVKE